MAPNVLRILGCRDMTGSRHVHPAFASNHRGYYTETAEDCKVHKSNTTVWSSIMEALDNPSGNDTIHPYIKESKK